MNDTTPLPAGRELDAEIATHVMGWTFVNERAPGSWYGKPFAADSGKWHWRALPFYSTDIAAAWTVVERMHDLDWIFVCSRDDIAHYCRFCQGEDQAAEYTHESMPLAICRAALAAIEAQ